MAERRENHGQTNLVPVPDDDASMPETVVGADLRPDGGTLEFSPQTRRKVNDLLDLLKSEKAELQEDIEGKLQIVYTTDKSDEKRREALKFVNTITAAKQNRKPLNVVFDESQIGLGPFGRYKEKWQFEATGQVLGRGAFAGDVRVVKDDKTGKEHALKEVTVAEFSRDEVLAWMDLGNSDTFPSLYMVRLDENKVAFHMEIVHNGVSLDGIIDSHMTNLLQEAPDLIQPFALCIYRALLSAVDEMHAKNWSHGDLHGGNVLVTMDSMRLKVLDFGKSKKLPENRVNQNAQREDILKALRLFYSICTGCHQDCVEKLEEKIQNGALLNEILSNTKGLRHEEKQSLYKLIKETYNLVHNERLEGYCSPQAVMKNIDLIFTEEQMEEVRKQAGAILFPDHHSCRNDISLPRGADGAVMAAVPGWGATDIEEQIHQRLQISDQPRDA